MLPKVLVWKGDNRNEVKEHLGVRESCLMAYEGTTADVQEFRHWVNNVIEILKSKPEFIGIIWDAHLLSWESQAVLLKPLEELEKSQIVLVTEAENSLTETVLSRCVLEKLDDNKAEENVYWPQVLSAWKEGPAACIALSDSLSQEEALVLAEEVLNKVHVLMRDRANKKRVEILKAALTLLEEMRAKNLNVKLCLGEFLLKGWKAANYT